MRIKDRETVPELFFLLYIPNSQWMGVFHRARSQRWSAPRVSENHNALEARKHHADVMFSYVLIPLTHMNRVVHRGVGNASIGTELLCSLKS